MKKGRYFDAPGALGDGGVVGKLLADFGVHQRRRNLAASTILNRRGRMLAFMEWLEVDRKGATPAHLLDPFTATTDEVERWLDWLELAPTGRYNYIVQLASFYRWAIREGHTAHDPTVAIDKPRLPRRLPRPVDDGGLADCLKYADPRMRAWLLLGAYQGCRCIEISRLRGEDISISRMTITVYGKGSKERTNALHPEVLAALVAYGLPRSGIVFPRRGKAGGQIQPSTISRYISRHLAETGTAHQLRHWFGTKFYDGSGGDLLLTQQALGHASPATTAIYAQVSGERGRGVIGGLGIAS